MQLSKHAQSLISGKYALGLLTPLVAKRWQRLMALDPELAKMTADWQQQLAPMAAWIPEQAVPKSLWQGIETELFSSSDNVSTLKIPLRRMPVAWLAAAMAAGISLWLALPSLMPSHSESTFSTSAYALATLSNEQNSVQWQVLLSDTNTLRLTVSSHWLSAPSRSLELWAIDANGSPNSLGLVMLSDDQATLKLSASQQHNLQTATLLAISDEPVGGSPTALPTGPVLFTGKPKHG